MSRVAAFLKDETGATAIEYGLLAAGISIVIIASKLAMATRNVTLLCLIAIYCDHSSDRLGANSALRCASRASLYRRIASINCSFDLLS